MGLKNNVFSTDWESLVKIVCLWKEKFTKETGSSEGFKEGKQCVLATSEYPISYLPDIPDVDDLQLK